MKTDRFQAVAGTVIATLLAGSMLASCAAWPAQPNDDTVADGIEQHASMIPSTDPSDSGADLDVLRDAVGDAQVVGLGEAAHGLAEITMLKHRTLRYLVEELGFRSIAWEEDWSLGLQINEYIQGHRDDRDALIGQMSTAWRSEEVADVLDWLREYNATHQDEVDFVGTEYFATRPFIYDDIEEYVARAAPDLLPPVRDHLAAIRPTTEDMGEYVQWYHNEVEDQEPYVQHAERLYELVAGIDDDESDAVAEHAARQIRSFYTAFALPDNFAFRDARVAENLHWWREHHGGRVIYWAASAHSADVAELTISYPPDGEATFASAGSFFRAWYGDEYVSIGFTFDHGTAGTDDEPIELPAPPEEWFEHPLGLVTGDQFLYDLRQPATSTVQEWLDQTLLTRGDPEAGPESTMSGGTPAEWFDLLIHRQEVTPATPIGASAP